MIALTIALAVLVGVSLGLLGGGGSILTVPLLAYVGGMDPKPAIATSLLVVGVTSAIAASTHARAGRVRWRVAVVFGSVAMTGAYGGGMVARLIPGTVLLVAFAVIMVAAGAAMLRGRKDTNGTVCDRPLPMVRITVIGLAVGMISGLVGAGGGFLLVPALALVAGLPMPVAVGSSLVVISMQSFAGLAGHLTSEQIDWRLAAFVTAAVRGPGDHRLLCELSLGSAWICHQAVQPYRSAWTAPRGRGVLHLQERHWGRRCEPPRRWALSFCGFC